MAFPRPGIPGSSSNYRVTCIKVTVVSIAIILGGFWIYMYNGAKQRKIFEYSDQIARTIDQRIMDSSMRVIHEQAPRVLYWENFLTAEECESFINISLPSFERSAVATPDKVEKGKQLSQVNNVRTSSGTWLSRSSTNPIVEKFTRRISMWANVPRTHGEDVQVLQYHVGQYYKPHFDFFDPSVYSEFLKMGGQRLASVLCFLNDVPKGGETSFPEVQLKVKPKKGDAILWYNTFPNGTLDKKALHGGEPVIEGVKYVAVQWLREFPRIIRNEIFPKQ